MTVHELYKKVSFCILLVDDHIEFSPTETELGQIIQTGFENDWDNNFFNSVTEMEIIDQLQRKPIESDLQEAISLANLHDRTKITKIHELLSNVQKYMYQNDLT